MTTPKVENDLKFEFLTSQIAEITDSAKWGGKNVIALEDAAIQEMIATDEKPFFVEFTALYEGMSGNDRIYNQDAVKSCADAMVGVNMYKGHQEPGTEGWKYREPVGRIVAAKVEELELPDGKRVLSAKGKAYITEADQKLRSDIRKKMAGNVSILGNAKMVRQMHETVRTVTHLHKPLKSVDFCNPGSGGLSHAGVTAVVSEMAGDETTEPQARTEEPKMTKLTKPELLTEYKTEIAEIVGGQVETQIQEIAASRRALTEEKEKFKDEKKVLDGVVSEMTAKHKSVETERDQWKAKFEAERDARIAAELAVFATAQVAEMKGVDGANEKLIDMAAKRVKATVIDGDLDKSKAGFKAAMSAALEEVTELAEMLGGTGEQPETPPTTSAGDKPVRRHANNPGKKGTALNRILSPEIVKARADRAGV